jgi:hypothetical protein
MVSKLGLKRLSNYHSNETAVDRATLMTCLLKKESWKAALSLTEKRQKAARQMKSTTDKKKELLTLTLGDDADGRI